MSGLLGGSAENSSSLAKSDKFSAQQPVEEYEEARRVSYNLYQKERRELLRTDYSKQKEIIDNLDYSGLYKYVKKTECVAHETRIGIVTMKANPHEQAAIKLALLNSGSRSARELFLKLITEAGLLKRKRSMPG